MKIFRRTINLIALLSAGFSVLVFTKNKAPRGIYLHAPKLLAGALQPFFGITGLVCALFGFVHRAWPALFAGMFSYFIARKYLVDTIILPQSSMFQRFDRAFGPSWLRQLATDASPQQKRAMLPQRWTWLTPKGPKPRWLRDIPYWSDPDTGRTLLCDIWSPPKGVAHTCLGILYFHGSAWCLGDKDLGTRDFFRHLAAEGYVIVDAQYGLIPETDTAGMLADAKRALSWLKTNSEKLGVDPQRWVTVGFSSGAQLSLLAAYTGNDPKFTPPDLLGKDLSVHGTVSFAGPYDLCTIYFKCNQPPTPYKKLKAIGENGIFRSLVSRVIQLYTGNRVQAERISMTFANLPLVGQMERILGGTPNEIPEVYALYSPITHVGPHVPPTFLVQGADDMWAPVDSAFRLCEKLQAAGVPVINLILPHAEHGFDLVLPHTSPPAQSALYELDRFLGLL